MQNKRIKIDIVSDVACPWCYVGKKRLESALEKWEGTPIEIEWHPFQLDPTIPKEGLDGQTYLKNKFGETQGKLEMFDHLKQIGAEEGIQFKFGSDWLVVNTLQLHQLLHVAGEEGFKDALKERFLKAYFEENLHLNEEDVLCTILSEFGWTDEKTKQLLGDDTTAYKVKQEIAHYQQLGVNSVPFFIIDNKYGISGAQPPNVFLDAFEQISSAPTTIDGGSCDTASGIC